MKVLVLFPFPTQPGLTLAQGDLLYRGLKEIGIEAQAVHYQSAMEKEWYYRCFQPDVVIGTGSWEDIPDLVLHPQQFGCRAVPWLLNGTYVSEHREILEGLDLAFVPSPSIKTA